MDKALHIFILLFYLFIYIICAYNSIRCIVYIIEGLKKKDFKSVAVNFLILIVVAGGLYIFTKYVGWWQSIRDSYLIVFG